MNSFTTDKVGSWMSLDLGSTRCLQVQHYCLRYGYNHSNAVLRNWNLEGSTDNVNWVVLRQHTNDTTMETKAYSEGHWTVSNAASCEFYRYFRIINTGVTSNQYHYLACSGIELYGTLNISGEF